MLPLALLTPLVFVAPTAALSFNAYISTSTCWVDYAQVNAIIEIVPIVILGCLAIIVSEATPMRKFKVHPEANKPLRTAAVMNARASIFISVASVGRV
jgi:hypothetical protein